MRINPPDCPYSRKLLKISEIEPEVLSKNLDKGFCKPGRLTKKELKPAPAGLLFGSL